MTNYERMSIKGMSVEGMATKLLYARAGCLHCVYKSGECFKNINLTCRSGRYQMA